MADRRELRVAPVMTGGTSLAVWMGGVTRELFTMARSEGTASVYGQLLDVTATTPVVDVITGTSAGGLNGSLLAAGLAFGVSAEQFDGIRETWMRAADLEQLLRDPKELDPPSLLRGDYFVQQITDVLSDWWSTRASGTSPAAEVDLVTTYTAVTPQPVFTRDDFGARLNEVVHAGTLRFRSADFGRDGIVAKLALASRTSASIPGVFEPVYLGAGVTAGDGAPDFGEHFASTATSPTGRWAVDGGVVVNLPLGEALDRIFDREATTDVRRVIMYVCPTPRGDAEPRADDPKRVPTLAESVTTVIAAPRAEGIASDVDRLAANNDQVRRQRALRRTLGAVIPVLGPQLGGEDSYPNDLMTQYRELRVGQSIDQMLARLRTASGGAIANEAVVRHLLRPAREALLPPTVDHLGGGGRVWGWGIAPVEQAISFALGVVSRSLDLAGWLPDGPAALHARGQLREAQQAIHGVRQRVYDVRRLDAAYWSSWAATTGSLADVGAEQLAALGTELYEQWPFRAPTAEPEDALEARRDAVFAELLDAHVRVGRIITDLEPTVTMLTSSFGTSPGDDPATGSSPARRVPLSVVELAAEVAGEVHGVYLAPVGRVVDLDRTAPVAGARNVRRQLLVAHVVQTLFVGNVRDREQPAELLQVSWNAPNELVDRAPDAKLVGNEVARLGAFLKPAWRANDWCWGRMDGAARLVQLLLDPHRLLQLGHSAADVLDGLGLTATPALLEELQFLDAASVPVPDDAPAAERVVPDVLPVLAGELIRRLQLEIAAVELPLIGEAIEQRDGDANEQDGGAFRNALAAAPLTAERVPAVLATMRVGEETAGREFGSNLTIRLATRAAGVTVNSLTGTRTGIPIVANLLRPFRAPLHGANAVIGVLAGPSPLARVLTAFVLAVAGAIVGVRLAGVEVSAWLVAASVFAIGVTGALSVLRTRGRKRMAVGWMVFAAFVGVVLIGPAFSTLLFDGPEPVTNQSLQSDDVIVLDGDVRLRIIDGRGDGAMVEDRQLSAGGTIELRHLPTTESAVTRGEHTGPATWKRWGFTNHWSAFTVAAIAAAVWLVERWRRGRDVPLWSLAVAAVIGVAGVSGLFSRGWRWLLTGEQPADGGVKRGFLDVATWLHEQRVGLLVVGFVVAGLLTATVWRRTVPGRGVDA